MKTVSKKFLKDVRNIKIHSRVRYTPKTGWASTELVNGNTTNTSSKARISMYMSTELVGTLWLLATAGEKHVQCCYRDTPWTLQTDIASQVLTVAVRCLLTDNMLTHAFTVGTIPIKCNQQCLNSTAHLLQHRLCTVFR